MTPVDNLSLDELDAIMNLQRQEAFDDNTEALHKSLSKRGSLSRKSPRKLDAESELRKFIARQAKSNRSLSPGSRSTGLYGGSRSSNGSVTGIQRSRSSGRLRQEEKTRTRSSSGNSIRSPRRSASYHDLTSARDSASSASIGAMSGRRGSPEAATSKSGEKERERRHGRRSSSGRISGGDSVVLGERYKKPAAGRSRRRSSQQELARGVDPPIHDVKDDKPPVQVGDKAPKSPPLSSKEKVSTKRPGSVGSGKKKAFEALLRNLPRGRTSKEEDGDAEKDDSANEESSTKKTKLQKIHELQAKCDRYKKEWLETSRDKKRLRNEIQEGREKILVLTKQIEAQTAEISILQRKLSETLQKLDELQAEQYKERNSYSMTAKELAESRIEFSKALNNIRDLKTGLDMLEESVKEKDGRIGDLEDELRQSKNQADELDSDLNFAEETVLKLERDMKLLQEELNQYRKVADEQNGEGDTNENLRKVRDDMEKRMFEDREERLREKQKKLEQKLEQFEHERENFLKEEHQRKAELERRIREEIEKSRAHEYEHSKERDDIAHRLDALESNNKFLQGRLKSEQLETQVKLRQKDERIELLQKELASITGDLAQLGSDPASSSSLKRELESAKSQSATLKDELTEVQKHNGMLTDEIEELRSSVKSLQHNIKAVRQELESHKNQTEQWQRKSSEWEARSGEWTDKAHLWKEKAEKWEKIAKDASPVSIRNVASPVDPQANFLQAALDRKKAGSKAESTKWGVLGGLLAGRGNGDEAGGDLQDRLQELETENASQAEVIKDLRKDMMTMQTGYKERAYTAQQQMQLVMKERDEVLLKNTNLMKELELARRLQSVASRDPEEN